MEIFQGHPVIAVNLLHYPALDDTLSLISEALQQKEGGFKKNSLLLRSFIREFDSSLKMYFLEDCFAWIKNSLALIPAGETLAQREDCQSKNQKVCSDIMSIAHDEGLSL